MIDGGREFLIRAKGVFKPKGLEMPFFCCRNTLSLPTENAIYPVVITTSLQKRPNLTENGQET